MMDVTVVRGDTYISSNTKINPNVLVDNQKRDYIALVIKTKVIQALDGTVSRAVIDDALSKIDYSPYIYGLNKDSRLLLMNLIKYQLFLKDINVDNINFDDIFSRL